MLYVPHGNLTKHEMHIATLVYNGYQNKEIAKLLSIQKKTVDNHIARIKLKLGLHTKFELAMYVNRLQLDSLPTTPNIK